MIKRMASMRISENKVLEPVQLRQLNENSIIKKMVKQMQEPEIYSPKTKKDRFEVIKKELVEMSKNSTDH